MKKTLLVIILFGTVLRFTNVNWDNFGAFHPDERNISWAITRIRFFSQMDPKFFAYGGLPIYLYRALGEGVVRATGNTNWLFDWGHIAVIGRNVSAILSTISIGLVYLVGAAYFSPAVGLMAATLITFSPWAIQQAHFDTTETMLVFFILLLLVIAKKITTKRVLLLGIVWGLSMAAKTTALLFGVIPFAAIWFPHIFKSFPKKLFFSFILVISASLCFFIFSPYTLLDFSHFNESMTYETGVALGRFSVPYTLQFVHTTPYIYQLVTMLWQAGPLVFVGLGGLVVLTVSVIPDLIGDLPFWKKTNTGSRLRGNDKNTIVFLIFPSFISAGWGHGLQNFPATIFRFFRLSRLPLHGFVLK